MLESGGPGPRSSHQAMVLVGDSSVRVAGLCLVVSLGLGIDNNNVLIRM